MGAGTAEIKIKADPTQLPTGLRAALKMVQGFVHETTGLMDPKKRGLDYKSIALGSAVGGVAANFAVRGIDFLADQAKQVFDFNRELVRFGIDIRKMPSEMEAIGKGIREISSATGLGAIDVLKAGRAYVDLAGAQSFTAEKMSLIARAAQASGADVKDMASLMFTLTENMNVPQSQLEDTIGGLINQAKDGSIHFRELAQELVALGPVYKQYGIAGREGAIQLGAMMQIARRGFGSASEAGTGVLRILRSLPQHASKFRKFGIEIFQPGSKTNLDQFLNIIQKIRDPRNKLSLDREALIKAFGRTEGERFYQLLISSNEEFSKLLEAGKMNGVVVGDLGTYVENSAGRMATAMQRTKNAVADAFTPERINRFVDAIETLSSKLDPVLSAVGKIGDLLGRIQDFGGGIRRVLVDNEENNPWFDKSDQEKMIENARDADERASFRSFTGRNDHEAENAIPQGVRDAADNRKFMRAGYSSTVSALIKAQGGEAGSPNAESIRTALLASKSAGWAGASGEQMAGQRYLSHVPQNKIDEVQKAYIQEHATAIANAIGTRIELALGKNKPPTAREQAIALQRALYEWPNISVNLDGNKVSTGVGNATDKRRK